MVLRYRVVRVLVGQHDACARLRGVRTLQTLLFQRVALQVLYQDLVAGDLQDLENFGRRVLLFEDERHEVPHAVVRVEELAAEVGDGAAREVAADDDVRAVVRAGVGLARESALHAHEADQLAGLVRDECDRQQQQDHHAGFGQSALGDDVAVACSRQRDHHEIQHPMQSHEVLVDVAVVVLALPWQHLAVCSASQKPTAAL